MTKNRCQNEYQNEHQKIDVPLAKQEGEIYRARDVVYGI
jgi:hypothetical protein